MSKYEYSDEISDYVYLTPLEKNDQFYIMTYSHSKRLSSWAHEKAIGILKRVGDLQCIWRVKQLKKAVL